MVCRQKRGGGGLETKERGGEEEARGERGEGRERRRREDEERWTDRRKKKKTRGSTSKQHINLTFSGRPGPSVAIFLSHGSRGMDLSPSHISGEQSAVIASSRSPTQLAIGPDVGWMIRCPDFPSCTHTQHM